MAAQEKEIKLVELPGAGAWKYTSGDGVVMVYSKAGTALTNERINWLLNLAKDKNLHG